ncbi:MAG: VOC family protein [Chloroflexi bacterium]|nr:VOC family protein [Chloroflexota bacterium]MBP8058411.1 VOC family protein [Chloroflexota bacterium]
MKPPRELVFKAITTPELYTQWLGPRKYIITLEIVEPRKGGSWRYTHGDPDGNVYTFNCVFHEVTLPEKIIQTLTTLHFCENVGRFGKSPGGQFTKLSYRFSFHLVRCRPMGNFCENIGAALCLPRQRDNPLKPKRTQNKERIMQKITPFLWFDNQAEEAMNFYTTIFPNSKISHISRYGENEALMTATFELNGQEFMVLNGGPHFHFTEAISFFVNCDTQEEVDYFWAKLTEGGEESQCGWLKDKYGLSWQIIPTALSELLSDPDAEKARRVMDAMLQMQKIDVNILRQA